MIGEKLSPVLVEIETALLELEVNTPVPPSYSIDGFRAASKIFMSAIMDKMWELKDKENLSIETMAAMAEKCGSEVRQLINTYTGIDTWELYKK